MDFYKQVAKDIVTARGLTKFDNTRYSHYRGIRWLILLRELYHFPFTIAALLEAKRRWGSVDVLHVNDAVYIVPALIAKWLFRAPLVVHVRSLQRVDAQSLRCRWLNSTLGSKADVVVAIDENTRATLPAAMSVEVIHNAFTAKRAADPDLAFMKKLAVLRSSSLKVGFVGNLHHSKGLFEMLEAAKLLRQAGRDIEFVIVGGVTLVDKGLKAWLLAKAGLAQNVAADLAQRVEEAGLGDTFHLMGATLDIKAVYDSIDVLCFASHYDAPGRPVFEAAFSSVPCIVSVDHPRPDTLIDGETGLAIPARDPARLAEAILHFADRPHEVQRMGANAFNLAQANFDPETNASLLLAVYVNVIQRAAAITAASNA